MTLKTGEFLFCGLQSCIILSNNMLYHNGLNELMFYKLTESKNILSVCDINRNYPGILTLCDIRL